ncbi:MAG TPA: co-chaperone GroES [Candidatus Paceibacterota bacterium]|nr:co-chaperone GroES [Candidatus Paceibacterota bacterium]
MKKSKKPKGQSAKKASAAGAGSGNKSGIQPLGDRVLIRPMSEEEGAKELPSGIIIPATVDKEKTDRGVVVAVGPGKVNDEGKIVPMHIEVGDKVLFQWGDKVEIDDIEYFVVSEPSVLAILK